MSLKSTITAVSVPAISEVTEAAIIFMHGLGDQGDGWTFLSNYVQRSPVVHSAPNIHFVFPNAPKVPVTVNNGAIMPAWFDLYGLGGRNEKSDHEGFLQSCNVMKDFIKKEMTEKNIPAEKIIIGGFSQGSAIAMGTMALLDFKIGGCVALSGFVPIPEKLKEVFKKDNCYNLNTPVFQGHGTVDPIISLDYGKETRDFYLQLGFDNWAFHEYPGLQHGADERELKDVLKFISSILD